MRVIGHQRPGEAGGARIVGLLPQSVKEVFSIAVVAKDLSFFDPAHHHVVDGAGSIPARGSRHFVPCWDREARA